MKVNFKWEVGDVIKMPLEGVGMSDVTITARQYIEDREGSDIWYFTELHGMENEYRQDQIEKHN